MESYIEITGISTCLTMVFSVLYTKYIAIKPVEIKKIWMSSLLLSILYMITWLPYAFIIFMIAESVYHIYLFQWHIKEMMISYTTRLFLNLTMYLLLGGGMLNGIWFVPIHTWGWIGYVLMVSFGILILQKKWGRKIGKTAYLYGIQLEINSKWYTYRGYLDTGNLATHQGIPIVFVYQIQHIVNKESISIQTVSDCTCMEGIWGKIKIRGIPEQPVWICFSNQIQLPYQATCLLNMKLMESVL